MKLPTSDKVSFGIKPHIKKGYYPGKLLKVEVFAESSGTPKIGKYGKQLIFEFALYNKDSETDAPISPMTYMNESKNEVPVIISKFVYHEYKNTEKDGTWKEEMGFRTAITPNSAITAVLKSLGWTFSTDDVDPEEFIGNWVELNIDDYQHGDGDNAYIASTIKDVSLYEGPEVGDVEDVKAPEKPKKVEKQVKHGAVKDNSEEIKKLKDKIESLKSIHKDGLLTDDGLKQATEQINTDLEALEQ